MSYTIRVVRCECGKIHAAQGISVTSRCTCDRLLWLQMWEDGR